MKNLKSITIVTDWARSRYWYNLRAFARAEYENKSAQIKKMAGGGGYDKESTVITSMINEALGETVLYTFGSGFSSVRGALQEIGFDIEKIEMEKYNVYLITQK